MLAQGLANEQLYAPCSKSSIRGHCKIKTQFNCVLVERTHQVLHFGSEPAPVFSARSVSLFDLSSRTARDAAYTMLIG